MFLLGFREMDYWMGYMGDFKNAITQKSSRTQHGSVYRRMQSLVRTVILYQLCESTCLNYFQMSAAVIVSPSGTLDKATLASLLLGVALGAYNLRSSISK